MRRAAAAVAVMLALFLVVALIGDESDQSAPVTVAPPAPATAPTTAAPTAAAPTASPTSPTTATAQPTASPTAAAPATPSPSPTPTVTLIADPFAYCAATGTAHDPLPAPAWTGQPLPDPSYSGPPHPFVYQGPVSLQALT